MAFQNVLSKYLVQRRLPVSRHLHPESQLKFTIHGGADETKTLLMYPNDILALQGAEVVAIQYRLGPFAFLTTEDSAAHGNFGMLDQVEALKWVKENIENFGGNPNKVTKIGRAHV